MLALTFLLALIFSFLAFSLKPNKAICVFFGALYLYSQKLTIPLGPLDFNLGRIVILVLFANVFFKSNYLLKTFKWSLMDTLVMLYMLGRFVALITNEPFMGVVEREAGQFLDYVVPYFAVRLIIREKDDLITFIKGMVFVAIPIAIMAFYETCTSHNPVGWMSRYYSFGMAMEEYRTYVRMGFYRSRATIGNPITLGLFFSAMIPLCLSLARTKELPQHAVFAISILMFMGAFASLSSGPFVAVFVCVVIIAVYPLRFLTPVFCGAVVALLLFIELFSNRHFYHVLTYFSLNTSTAYYRIGLLDEAFGGGMTGKWPFGWGYVGLFSADERFPWEHKDMTNIYIKVLVNSGLCGLFPFLLMNGLYYKKLVDAMKITNLNDEKWMIWCVGALMVSWNIALMTVSPLGVTPLFWMLIGICTNFPVLVKNSAMEQVPSVNKNSELTMETPIMNIPRRKRNAAF